MRLNNAPSPRLTSIDALRGVVMIVMALDHVRDFFHRDAMAFSPTDLTKTTAVLFFTRWITHFCLPVFMFTAGTGIFLFARRNRTTPAALARFLLSRGLWFVFLELTVMQFAYNFGATQGVPLLLLILWIFGICLAVMAALVYLPVPALVSLGLLTVLGHNLLDGIAPARFGAAARLWNLVHQPGIVLLGSKPVLVTYTLLPWIAVMALGYAFGRVFEWDPPRRRRFLRWSGFCSIAAFFLLRALNRYGDPAPWAAQKSAFFTALSFLNTTKYPASLDFLLMTLGPALLLLSYFDRRPPQPSNPIVLFGRVPLFYFILHFYLIHALVVVMGFLRYGDGAERFIFQPVPSMGGPRQLFPPDFGWSLSAVYLLWLLVVVLLYPACRWYAGFKARKHSVWLSYL